MAVRRGSGLPCLVYLAGHDLTQKVVHQSLVGQAERYRLTDENYALVLQGDLPESNEFVSQQECAQLGTGVVSKMM